MDQSQKRLVGFKACGIRCTKFKNFPRVKVQQPLLPLFLREVCESVMAQFGFENDIHNILKLDMPITNAPMMARWQRKGSSSNAAANQSSLSPGKSANSSQSLSKTPSKTPGKSKKTPSKMGGDRYIPIRNSKQMDVANFLLTKENEPHQTTETQKFWSVSLNGYNINDAKILHVGGQPLNAPEGYQNNLKVLYSQVTTPASLKKTRYISLTPDRILDAPDIRNDFYLNLLDWSNQNVLAVALHNSVYMWDATIGDVTLLMKMKEDDSYICSLSWTKEGSYLAVGTSDCTVQLWDVEIQKRLRTMNSHTTKVGSLSWNDYVLSSGSRSGHIHHHDVRVAEHHICSLHGHTQEVCGLKWSPDGRYLASGGNDNLVNLWPRVQEGNSREPLHRWTEHQGAVKALAWCPWQSNILASGGGTSDRHIRTWNVSSGSCISSLDTQSQISSLVFAPNYKELVSAHGYSHNNVVIWKYPSLSKVAELNGHENRVLSMVLSPDCSTVATVAGDETIRLWKSFELDPVKKKTSDKMPKTTSSVIHQSIR